MVQQASPTSPPAPRLTVLLANEPAGTESWLATVQHLLAPLGVNLLTASTGRQALNIIESGNVHVAVLDHRLPQLGGLQVVKLVREHAARNPVPTHRLARGGGPATILLADHLTTPLLHEALSMSVFTVLAKPVNYPQLLDAMARAMRRFHNSQWPTSPHANQ